MSVPPEETDRSGSPPEFCATVTVTLDAGCADRATPNVVLLPCCTATFAGLTTTVGASTVIATGYEVRLSLPLLATAVSE